MIGEALRQLREKRKVTRKELASRLAGRKDCPLKRPWQWIYRLETGQRWLKENQYAVSHHDKALIAIACEELGITDTQLKRKIRSLQVPQIQGNGHGQ